MSDLAGSVSRDEGERLLVRYVGIHSVNPAIDGGAGEAALATAFIEDLTALGIDARRQPVAPGGRDNVVARLEGSPDAPVVMYEAHMDTVGLSGRAQADAVVSNGMVHGRGSCDTKGAMAAIVLALEQLQRVDPARRATVVAVGSIDEEVAGTGAAALVDHLGDIDMAVVGEPTELEMVTAHKGVLRFEIRTTGSPAHSSKPHLGRNAIYAMSAVLDALAREYAPGLTAVEHPLVGHPTVSVSTISGGSALNVVPAECVINVDRRVVPGESHEAILATVDDLLAGLDTHGCEVVRHPHTLATAPLDTPSEHPLVEALARARYETLGDHGTPKGVTFGSDASLYAPAGVPCVVFGPGSIDQAHTDDEWVPIEQTAQAAEILALTALNLAGSG